MLGVVPGAFEQERGIGSQELLACHYWLGAHLGTAGFHHAGMTCAVHTTPSLNRIGQILNQGSSQFLTKIRLKTYLGVISLL